MKNQDGVALGYTLLQETLDLQKAVRQLTRTENPSKELLQTVDNTADALQGTLLLVPNFVQEANRLSRIGRGLYELHEELIKLTKSCQN